LKAVLASLANAIASAIHRTNGNHTMVQRYSEREYELMLYRLTLD
jgi:hypothetical protein